MSGGHRHHDGIGLSGNQLDRVLNSPPVRDRLLMQRKISRDYDMPYVGGYSTDGKTIYLDRHLPEEVELELDGQKKLVRPDMFLAEFRGHEPVEWSVMDGLGWTYGHAHNGPATGSERRKVLIYLGPGWWGPWQRCMEHYIKVDAHEKIVKMPKDYDLRPILFPPVNHALLAAVKKAMGVSDEGKCNKKDVNYSEGMASSHCGPVKAWPRGECRFYEEPNSCEKVKGNIDPRYWCELHKGVDKK